MTKEKPAQYGRRADLYPTARKRCRGIVPGALASVLVLISSLQGSDSVQPLQIASTGGFCADGVYSGTLWPDGKRPDNLHVWGSFCGNDGDKSVGHTESQNFLAPSTLNLYLAGYPGLPGRRLLVKNMRSGEEMEIKPQSLPREHWQFNSVPLPSEWVGKPVELIGEDTSTEPAGWFAFTLPLLAASSLAVPIIDTSVPPSGFCANGVWSATKWPDNVRPPGIVTWGSYCRHGDADTGWRGSQPVDAGAYISIYSAGYPGNPGIRLVAENMQTRRQIPLQTSFPPTETWQLFHFRLPSEWKGQRVRIVAADAATGACGWLGFSEPVPHDVKTEAVYGTQLIMYIVILVSVLLIPSIAACMFAATRGVDDEFDLMATGLATLGLTGYAAFWLYFFSRLAGMIFSYAGLLACCAAIGYFVMTKARRAHLQPLKQLLAPTMLVVLATVFILSLGLMHGGGAEPGPLARSRFAPPVIALDNEIPKIFADGLFAGHIPRPIMASFLSSDRPPLQAGNTVWTYVWTGSSRDLPYQVLSVFLQCSFLAALWSFLKASNIDPRALAVTVIACFFSGFSILNQFYTWPKFFPVSFLLIAAVYLFTDRYHQVRERAAVGALLGASAAFAMLGHGGSVLAIAGIGCGMLLLRRIPGPRFLLGLVIAFIFLYTPWSLYQKFYDPPGDRLMKWHLAGVIEPRPQARFTDLLLSQYGKLNAAQVSQLKLSNFEYLWGNVPEELRETWRFMAALASRSEIDLDPAAGAIRRSTFMHWVPSIGLALFGPLALLAVGRAHRHRAEFIAASRMWLLTGLTLVIWCLVMFGPDATYPHHGTYFTEVLAFAGSYLAFWMVRPWLAVAALTAQVLWTTMIFIWLAPTSVATGIGGLFGPVDSVLCAVCLLSAAAIAILLATHAYHRMRFAQH